ncbi:hypothetical protein [Mycobacterium marinum]|uniref:hypothetical protein n=1 Tax=Mycobacterium marinum TaxID=1781 RepID=UPI003568AEB1
MSGDGEEQRQALHQKIDALSPQEVVVVIEYVDALLTPVRAAINPSSWLVTAEWADAFLARLRAHHALSKSPLSRTQFESAFEASCETAGWHVTPTGSAVHRFFDTTIARDEIEPRNISLKGTAAADMKPGWVHISKLTEGAWIQDARVKTVRRNRIVELFQEFRAACYCIMILRCFRRPETMLYELVEIPSSLFDTVDQLDVAAAQADTIGIPPGSATPHLKIRIDRSDAKITLTGIELDACIVHGRWELSPNPA